MSGGVDLTSVRPTRDDIARTALGITGGENFPLQSAGSGGAMISQTLYFTTLGFRAGDLISNIIVQFTAAGSAVTLFKAAVYATDGQTRHAVSADFSASVGIGRKTIALGTPYAVPSDTGLHVALLAVAGTGPSAWRSSNGTFPNTTGWTVVPFGNVTGQTDMPSTYTPAVGGGTAIGYWVGWS